MSATRRLIEEKLASLSSSEKSEFDRRLRCVLNSKALKIKLAKQHNAFQEAHQQKQKIRRRNEIAFLISAFVSVALISFFGIDNSPAEQIVGILVFLVIATHYFVRKEISDSFYLMQFRNYQFEIDRLTNEIDQYGHFLVSDSKLFFEYDGSNDALESKFLEITSAARIELELEVLENMHLDARV